MRGMADYSFFLCWSSLGGHLFWTPSKSYISVNFTHYNYKFMPWCGYCKVFLSPALIRVFKQTSLLMPLSWVVEILWSGVHFHYNNNPLHFTLNDSREQFRCKLKNVFFAKFCCKFLAYLRFFCTTNAENYYFNQRLECAAPKCWSKYTTAAIPKIRRTEWKWKPTRSIQLLKIKQAMMTLQLAAIPKKLEFHRKRFVSTKGKGIWNAKIGCHVGRKTQKKLPCHALTQGFPTIDPGP